MFFRYFLITAIFFLCGLQGETLEFKKGDKASYRIEQQADYTFIDEEEDEWLPEDTISTASYVEFEIKVLSVSEEAYPIEVEVIVKDVGFETGLFKLNKNRLAHFLKKPLHFTIDGDFQVTETTSLLATLEDDLDGSIGTIGLTPWSFQCLLTQLFHLHKHDLELCSTHPVSCYPLACWDGEELDEYELDIEEASQYVIEKSDKRSTSAKWLGMAAIFDDDYAGYVEVEGTVEWSNAHPLRQHRELTLSLEEHFLFWGDPFFATQVTAYQKWIPLD